MISASLSSAFRIARQLKPIFAHHQRAECKIVLLLLSVGRDGRVFCKELRGSPFQTDRSHCFITALILKPSVRHADPLTYVTQKKCVAADIMIMSAVGDKNSSTRLRLASGDDDDDGDDDYLKDNLCYLCHQGNDRR